MRILVADDDSISRSLLSGVLGKAGYEVVLAGDGKQALQILADDSAPELVILL